MNAQNRLHRFGNYIGLIMICIVLLIAFYDQLCNHELPCPLCLLQRVCFIAVGLCMCMNLKQSIRTLYYGLMMISALLGFGVSFRQALLHMQPGDPGYGSPIFGIYLYTWSVIGFLFIIGFISIAMLFEYGFVKKEQKQNLWTMSLMIFFLVLIFANVVSTFLECGPFFCPADPVNYYMLNAKGH